MQYLFEYRATDDAPIVISAKKAAIQKAAEDILKADAVALQDCLDLITRFTTAHCYPFVYVIDWQLVKGRAQKQRWTQMGNPWSWEVLIPDIKPAEFELLSFKPIIL